MERKFLTQRYNSNNRFLTEDDVNRVMRSLDIPLPVNDVAVYQQAFVHRSYLRNSSHEHVPSGSVPFQEQCNETYEYLGDTILNSIVGSYLYERYRGENEGFLTKARTKMVRGTTLGELARRLGFGDLLVLSKHVENEGGRTNLRILEDTFEAFIAAIYLDNGSEPIENAYFGAASTVQAVEAAVAAGKGDAGSDGQALLATLLDAVRALLASRSNGYLYAQKFTRAVYTRYVDIDKLAAFDDNYKEQLQTYYQKKNDMFPKWELLNENGRTGNRLYTVCVRDRCGFVIGKATEKKKVEAEQSASRSALIYFGVIDDSHCATSFFR